MSERLSVSLGRIIILEEQLRQSRRVNRFLWVAIIVMWGLKIARIILGFVKPAANKIIPLWLDIII
jgi:hypothetical protein